MVKRGLNQSRNQFESAAISVLVKAKRPLTIREIVERMIEQGLASSSGKTPQNTMFNTIRRANARRKATGEPPLFVASRDGAKILYSLAQ